MKLIKYYYFIGLPALIVHEILHFIVIKLTRSQYNGIEINTNDYYKNGEVEFLIYYCTVNYFSTIAVALAPLIALTFWIIPFIIGFNTIGVIMLIYTILYFKTIIPSKDDIDTIKNHQSCFELD